MKKQRTFNQAMRIHNGARGRRPGTEGAARHERACSSELERTRKGHVERGLESEVQKAMLYLFGR